MKRKVIVLVLLLVSSILVVGLAFLLSSNLGCPIPGAIRVPQDFRRIQWAVGNASHGDVVWVRRGTYKESVTINKPLTLMGQDKSKTVIESTETESVLLISGDSVNVSGFTIRNARAGSYGVWDMQLDHSNNSVVSENIMSNGVWLWHSNFNLISGNVFTLSDQTGYSVRGQHSEGNRIINNMMSNGRAAIKLDDSRSNVIIGNMMLYNFLGIELVVSGGCILRENYLVGNLYSLLVSGWNLSDFIQDVDTSNTVNGKVIYYFVNQTDVLVDASSFPNAASFEFVNSKNITVKDLKIVNSAVGVHFCYTTNSSIVNLIISDSMYGIDLRKCSGIRIYNNTFLNNRNGIWSYNSSDVVLINNTIGSGRYDGIILTYSARHALVGNIILNRELYPGIHLQVSDECAIIGNTVTNSSCGIRLQSSGNNVIHHNNFINNAVSSEILSGGSNIWDDGAEGNYWSDYVGADADQDGIGDVPYVIDENNRDSYPFMYAL